MERADLGLAFMLQYENVAWYEAGAVKILDRRVYPRQLSFVLCYRHEEVAQAIADMVTQSAGPYTAAGMGMALAAYEARNKSEEAFTAHMKSAAYILSHARPTSTALMAKVTSDALQAAISARKIGQPVDQAVMLHTIDRMNQSYTHFGTIAEYLVDKFPSHGTIMTQCFGEIIVGQMLKVAKTRQCQIKLICPETRPYFQGARLTATVAYDMGFDVTVITDNMPACTMQMKKVDLFTSAADVICMDGYVVNKVGTFQIAIAAKYLDIPYYVTGSPNKKHPSIDTVTIEERNPQDVLMAMGIPTVMEGVKGFYPAFDTTPPHLVTGVVTKKGVLSPFALDQYYI